MISEHAGNWWRLFECCILNAKIVWSWNKFKKHWSARVTDEFSSEGLILRKRLSSLYTKCVQFSPWPSLFFYTCYAGSNDDTMPSFDIFIFYFVVIFNFTVILISKQIGKWLKNSKWCQRVLKIDDVALNGAYGTQKKSGVAISLKKCSASVTDEFSSETLILRKRLSSLYTKCIQFLP